MLTAARGLDNFVRQLTLVEDGGVRTDAAPRPRVIDVDQMLRRRACMDGAGAGRKRADLLVACALRGCSLPAGALPPEALPVLGNATMCPWLPTMDVRSETALCELERTFEEYRKACLGAADSLDRLRAVDAVRRSLIVAVSRADQEIVTRAVSLLNDLGACGEDGSKLAWRDCTSLEALDKALDAKVRPLEYWLAIHHFERSWLNERRRDILRRTSRRSIA